jgi:DNA repair and recombination protein RAD52
MFTEEINTELKKKLNPKNVATRKSGKTQLSYVEGWHVIAEMNRVFGFGGWTIETIFCNEVCKYATTIAKGKDWEAEGFTVGYESKVRITVGDVVREGTGLGSGIGKDLFDCYEGAAKEAETDALKRACMKFGNVFGLALYDKTQENVGVEPIVKTSEERGQNAIKLVKEFATIEEFETWYAKEGVKKSLSELDATDEAKVKAACADKRSKHENVTSTT